MTLTLELTPEQETKLRAQAEALELTPDAYLLRVAGLGETEGATEEASDQNTQDEDTADVIPPGQSLADALAGRVGTINSAERNGGEVSRLSEKTGESFTNYLIEKKRQGRF